MSNMENKNKAEIEKKKKNTNTVYKNPHCKNVKGFKGLRSKHVKRSRQNLGPVSGTHCLSFEEII